MSSITFNDLKLNDTWLNAIEDMGYKNPTPIQQQAIPVIIDGKDILACAQTGTGKTAAFLLPVLQKVTEQPVSSGVHTLILVPTRELALQIDQQVTGLSYYSDVSAMAIYGGGDGVGWEQQKAALKSGIDILVATPGKLISHINMGYVNLENLKCLVMDEADRMLDMGFIDDIRKIVQFTNPDRQTLMFSATMPEKIRKLANQILREPTQINLAISKPASGVAQQVVICYEDQKLKLVEFILSENQYQSVLIFASTRKKVKQFEKEIHRLGLNIKAIHSDLEQNERENVLLEFKSLKLPYLIATDVISRGIDIDSIELVINIDVPGDAEDYIHRVGRTARAARKGKAITFVAPLDFQKLQRIEKLIESEIERMAVPEAFGKAPAYEITKSNFARPNQNNGPRRPFKKHNNSKPSA